jgi:hypothetical protein
MVGYIAEVVLRRYYSYSLSDYILVSFPCSDPSDPLDYRSLSDWSFVCEWNPRSVTQRLVP